MVISLDKKKKRTFDKIHQFTMIGDSLNLIRNTQGNPQKQQTS